MVRQALTVILGILLVLTVAAPMIDGGEERRTTAATPPASPVAAPIVRETLSQGLPPTAPGQRLELVRYTIASGAVLPIHIHPGMQAAWIESGELTYNVLKGEVPVTRQGNQQATDQGEIVAAGQTTVLLPGDAIIEPPGVVHYGENLGTEPVVIWAAVLTADGQPAAILVNPEGTPVG